MGSDLGLPAGGQLLNWAAGVQQVRKPELWSPISGAAFLVHVRFSHLNWLSGALRVVLAPQKSTRYWESNSPGVLGRRQAVLWGMCVLVPVLLVCSQ